ncbi:MAG: type II toxin-antitoxin system VapC family toxin [Spirochaetales bacterium]|nr:type II toxin-antitoxin system VapC family toxin [Spirochaetales bacterium]
MTGNKYILDTNIILYILGGKLDIESLPDGNFYISIITEIELLSYPSLNKDEELTIKQFLKNIDIIDLNKIIKEKTIELRKKYKIKIPDSIICATALFEDAILISNDKELFKVSEVNFLRKFLTLKSSPFESFI